MLFTLPSEIQRRVLRYVGEVDLCDEGPHHMHRASLVYLDARKSIVCVPRQLYLVSHWHTYYPCGAQLQKLFRDVIPVHAFARDEDTYRLLSVEVRPSRKYAHAWSRLTTPYNNGERCTRIEPVCPSGFVAGPGHAIRSRPRGALEPFSFLVDTNDAILGEC